MNYLIILVQPHRVCVLVVVLVLARVKTCGRGVKGQKSRSGVSIKGFAGGQMPLYRRLPKRGFNNIFAKQYEVVNLGRIQKAIDDKKLDIKKPIDAKILADAGLVGKVIDGVRLLAKGELNSKLILILLVLLKLPLLLLKKLAVR